MFQTSIKGVIIEKNQPLATILTNPSKFNKVENKVKIAIENKQQFKNYDVKLNIK